MRPGIRFVCIVALLLVTSLARAQGALQSPPKPHSWRLCLFDVAGRQGEVYALMKNYQLSVMREGVALDLVAYTHEPDIIRDYEAGRCDLAGLSDLAVRRYNRFTGSISAIGTVPNYSDLTLLLKFLPHRRLARFETENGHEILGVLPLGAVYLYVRDRRVNTVEALRGQRVAVLGDHTDAQAMIRQVGAIPVATTIDTFAAQFKRGEVDIIYAPGAAYEVLELYQGLEPSGGIIRFPLGQFTLQLVAREGTFNPAFVQRSRQIVRSMASSALRKVLAYEQAIPERMWVDLPKRTHQAYLEMIRTLRLNMTRSAQPELARVYHPTMLRLLRKIRCYNNPMAAECSAANRE